MRVVLLWGGGKDSCLAYHKAIAQNHNVVYILTFVPSREPYIYHPLSLMSLQSKALGIPHLRVKIEEPSRDILEAISRLKKREGIEGIVTGDIFVIDHRRWYGDLCERLGMDLIMPLWGLDRYQVLNEAVSGGFRAVFTCVRQPFFDEEWLGRELDGTCIEDLKALSEKYGMDPCGEKGEYHTMVIDAPIFKEVIEIRKFSKERKDPFLFMKIKKSLLKPKAL